MSLTLTGAGPPPGAWSPARLPGLAPAVVPSLSRVHATHRLWQDAGKTTPAIADGDPVRVATCPFTGADYVAPSDSARPVLHTDGLGHWWLTFDGVDDQLAASTAPTPSTAMSAFAAVYFTDLSTNRTLLGSSAGSGGPFYFCQGSVDKKQYLFDDNVTALPGGNAALSVATWYLTGVTYSSPAIAYHLNRSSDGSGSQAATFTGKGDQVGALRNTNRLSGQIAALVWGTAQWSAADVASLETYIRGLYP